MSIRKKTIFLVVGVVVALFLVVYGLTYQFLLRGFSAVETDEAVKNIQRLDDSIKANLGVLSTKTADWGRWDDAYNFMIGEAPDFEEANLGLESVRNLQINLMAYVATSGQVVSSRLVGLNDSSETNIPLPDDFLFFLESPSLLLTHPSLESHAEGIVLLESGPMLVSARPIVDSDGSGPSHGTIIFGRYLDKEMIDELSSIIHLEVVVEEYSQEFRNDVVYREAGGKNFGVVRIDGQKISSFTVLNDINSKPILKVSVFFDRTTYGQGLSALRLFSVFYFMIGLVFLLVIIFILERLILSRLSLLGGKVDNIRITRNLNQSVAMSGSDEFAKLSQNIDDMLVDLRISQKMVGERDQKIADELKQIEEKNETLEHTQRAVLNVLEDLEEEKKKIEETVAMRTGELKEEKTKLVASINSLPIGFAIFSPARELLVHNEVLSKILDFKYEDASLGVIKDRLKGSFDLSESLTKVQEEGVSVAKNEIVFGNKFIKLFLAPAKDEAGGQPVGYLLLVEDITEAKMLERTREEFFAVASHELRTPLTAIRGNMSMIKDFILPSLNNPDLTEMINDSYNGAVRLISIVNDFLDASRLEQGKVSFKLEPVDVFSVVSEVVKELEAVVLSKKLILKMDEMSTNLPKILADRDRVKQIIFNLVGNAVNYTREGSVTLKASSDDKFVKIAITDTGVGISPVNQQRLFKKFQQAQGEVLTRDMTKSTGLGLYISKMLAEGMDGNISLDQSELGKGSTFSVNFPIATEGASGV